MHWYLSHHAHPIGCGLADRHYSRKTIGAPQFMPPGRKLVLLTKDGRAVWGATWARPEFINHAWKHAFLNTIFRNEGDDLSSDLITDAVAAVRWFWPDVPEQGVISFIDIDKTRHKRDPGRCYRKAGFHPAICPIHGWLDLMVPECASCQSLTKGGHLALQLLPCDMPAPEPYCGATLRLF